MIKIGQRWLHKGEGIIIVDTEPLLSIANIGNPDKVIPVPNANAWPHQKYVDLFEEHLMSSGYVLDYSPPEEVAVSHSRLEDVE